MGERLGDDNKMCRFMLRLDDIEQNGTQEAIGDRGRYDSYSKVKFCVIGHIYEFECIRTDGKVTSVYPNSGRKVGEWINGADKLEWATKERIDKLQYQKIQISKKQTSNNMLIKAITPIHKIYGRLPAGQRKAFKLLICELLDDRANERIQASYEDD